MIGMSASSPKESSKESSGGSRIGIMHMIIKTLELRIGSSWLFFIWSLAFLSIFHKFQDLLWWSHPEESTSSGDTETSSLLAVFYSTNKLRPEKKHCNPTLLGIQLWNQCLPQKCRVPIHRCQSLRYSSWMVSARFRPALDDCGSRDLVGHRVSNPTLYAIQRPRPFLRGQ